MRGRPRVAADPGNYARYHVFNQNGTRLYPTSNDPNDTFPWPTTAALQEHEFSKVQYQGESFRMLSQTVSLDGKTYRIIVGSQLRDNRLLVAQFSNGLLWTIPVFLIFSAAFGYFLSRRALQPVSKLIASFRSISIGNLSRRLPTLHSGDELEALTETCNEMLARLDRAVVRLLASLPTHRTNCEAPSRISTRLPNVR